MRILIVEDDGNIRGPMASMARQMHVDGMEVYEAASVTEALEMIKKFLDEKRDIDLLITDYDLGETGQNARTGLDVLAAALKMPKPPTSCFMTANVLSEELVRRARDNGATRFFGKPFEFESLARVIRSMLPRY